MFEKGSFINSKISYYFGGALVLLTILFIMGLFKQPLPFVDLVAYAHLDGLSPKLLANHTDYYVTQFSYIFVHFLTRFLIVWGVKPIAVSTTLFYLQALCLFLFWSC